MQLLDGLMHAETQTGIFIHTETYSLSHTNTHRNTNTVTHAHTKDLQVLKHLNKYAHIKERERGHILYVHAILLDTLHHSLEMATGVNTQNKFRDYLVRKCKCLHLDTCKHTQINSTISVSSPCMYLILCIYPKTYLYLERKGSN